MPYIKPDMRPPFDEVLDQLPLMETAEEAEYVLAAACDKFLPHQRPMSRPEFEEVIDQLPAIPTAGTLGYVVAVILDKYLLRRADQDTAQQLRFMYQGQVYGVIMRTIFDYWSQGPFAEDARARDICGLLTSILFDYFHCVQEPYENDVRARTGEVWKSGHRLPGHAGNSV